MRKCWEKIIKKIIASVLIVALVLPNTVVAAPKPQINKKSIFLCKKEKYQLKISHQRKKPKWKSTNKKIVTVNKNGLIKGKKSGIASIYGYAGGKKYKCKVTITDNKKSVYAGKTILLKMKSLKKYKKWNSSSTKIATVNKSGKVKAKKAGTVVITAKYKKKIYRFKLVVKKPEPATIYVNKYNNKAIVTDNSTYVLRGTIKSKGKIKRVSASYNSDSNKKTKTLKINGTKKWQTKGIKLDIGYNYVTISALLTSGKSVKKKIQINRRNKDLKLNRNVISFNPGDKKDFSIIKKIQTEILGSIIDNKGTEDVTDDELLLAVYNDNPLLQKIKKGEIKPDQTVYIPENKYFPEGLTLKYLSCDDNYLGELEYDKEHCEVIHFAAANFFELFSGNIYLDYEGLENSEISSIYTPSKKEDNGIATFSNDTEDNNEEDNGSNSGEKGFQFKNLAAAMKKGIKLDKDNLSFEADNLVLYDNDGNLEDTDDDQVVLSGSLAYSGLKANFQPNSSNENVFKSTVEFSEQTNINMKWGKGIDFFSKIKEELKEADEENTQNINSKVALSGVDMDESIVLGVVAISTGAKKLSVSNSMNDIVGGVDGFSPKIFVTILLDLDGSVKVETSLTYDHQSYHKTGVAVKKGIYTKEDYKMDSDLRKDKIHEIDFPGEKISYAVIDKCQEVKEKENSKPESTIKIGCEGSAELSAGIGLGIGIGVLGIVPVLAKLGVMDKMSIKGDLNLILSNHQLKNAPKEHPNMIVGQSNVQGTNSLVLNGAVFARVGLEIGEKTIEIGKDIEQNGKDLITLADEGFFITNPKGTIYDGKDPVSDVKVSFIEIKDDGTIKELGKNTVSNEKGEYDINLIYYPQYEKGEAPFSERTFGLKFENEDYETTYAKFEDKYWDGIESFANIKLEEKIKEGEYRLQFHVTDSMNDDPLQDAEIVIDNQKFKTNADGNTPIIKGKGTVVSISIQKDGYTSQTMKLDTSEHIKNPIEVQLSPANATDDVCRIGNRTFKTLEDAVVNSKKGDTIELYGDDKSTNTIKIDHDLTITAVKDVHSNYLESDYMVNHATLTLNALDDCTWDFYVTPYALSLVDNYGVLNIGNGILFHSTNRWSAMAIANYKQVNITTEHKAFYYLSHGVVNYNGGKCQYDVSKQDIIFDQVTCPTYEM